MFSLRKWLIGKPTVEWKHATSDPVLGELRLSDDGEWWNANVHVGDLRVQFYIGGEGEPAPNLILNAQDIIRDFSSFQHKLAEHLASEASKRKAWAQEIQHLKIESIQLFWPDRPNEGEIAFSGPDPYRLWHCSYQDGEFVGLGFDD